MAFDSAVSNDETVARILLANKKAPVADMRLGLTFCYDSLSYYVCNTEMCEKERIIWMCGEKVVTLQAK